MRDEVEYWLAFERQNLRPLPVDFPGGVDSFGSIDWAVAGEVRSMKAATSSDGVRVIAQV